MASQSTYKLLEINLISARDLPPLSKVLRTFAVAYVTPDHKLTTKIDHQGHTNPTWNYKMQFHVELEFLKQESSTLTVEIYNLAWLRDLPIGTAHLNLNTLLSAPPSKNKSGQRFSLQVCRPNGFLKGKVNLSIQLVDVAAPDDDVTSLRDSEIISDNQIPETNDSNKLLEDLQGPNKIPVLEKNSGTEIKITTKSESVCSTPESIHSLRPDSEPETTSVKSGGSDCSSVRPMAPEVADDLKRGFLIRAKAAEYGSEIFENWTEAGDESSDDKIPLGPEYTPRNDLSFCSTPETISTLMPDSEPETRTVTSGGSDYALVRPMAPEVADNLKREFLRAKAAEYGSDIFDNWTDVGDESSDDKIPGPETAPRNESFCSTPETLNTSRLDSEPETRTVTSGGSDYALVRPMAPEEMDDLKRGFLRAKAAEYESDILENSEAGDVSSDDKIPGPEITHRIESFCSTPETLNTSRLDSEPETRTVTSGGSDYALVRPMAPEEADELKRGFLRAKAAEYGSDIFENWTEADDASSDDKIPGPEITPRNESFCSTPETSNTSRPDSEPETRTTTSGGSDYSLMRPLPAEATDYGSEIFENWTEVGDMTMTSNETESKAEKGEWKAEAVSMKAMPAMSELPLDLRRKRPEKPVSKRMFKIFGCNAYGLEFSFICGSNKMKMNNKKKDLNRVHVRASSDEKNLGKFYKK